MPLFSPLPVGHVTVPSPSSWAHPESSVSIKTSSSPLDAHKGQVGSLKNTKVSGDRTEASGSFYKVTLT